MMDVRKSNTAVGSSQICSLLCLPIEIQNQIYQNYYVPWSLTVRDHSFGIGNGPLPFLLPRSALEEQFESCPHNGQPCPSGRCPEADPIAFFNHEATPTDIPSINLILACRSIHAIAYPFFASSYDATVDIKLTDYCFANTLIRNSFISHFEQFLANRTTTLHLDVSGVNSVYSRHGLPNLNLSTHVPNLRNITLKDRFKLTNTYGAFEKLRNEKWSAESTPQQQLDDIMLIAIRKRTDLTGSFWWMATLLEGFDTKDQSAGEWTIMYAYQCRIEGLEGTYEATMPINRPIEDWKDDTRKLQDDEIDEQEWHEEIEVADYEERAKDCLVM